MTVTTLSGFRSLDMPVSEIVTGRVGFIHDIFTPYPYEIVSDLPRGERDIVVLISRENRRAKLERLAEHGGRVVAVMAPSDASVRPAYLPGHNGFPPNVVRAFVTNNEFADRRVINVPLGLRINKVLPLKFVRQHIPREHEGLLYGNFTLNDEHYRSTGGEPHIRARLAERFRDEPWTKLEIFSEQQNDESLLFDYYANIARHRFTLSPEGNGIDCYRHWESLYLGTIPIVMVSPATTSFVGLPMLYTRDYSEITEGYLDRVWRKFSRQRFDLAPMFRSYYLHKFVEAVGELHEPRFLCWGFGDTQDEKFHNILKTSSRSPSGVLAEAPTPPYMLSARKPRDPKAWEAPRSVRVERTDAGTRVILVDEAPQLCAALPFRLLVGTRFTVRGKVWLGTADAAGVKVVVRGREDDVLAEHPVTSTEPEEFALHGVANVETLRLAVDRGEMTKGPVVSVEEVRVDPQLAPGGSSE